MILRPRIRLAHSFSRLPQRNASYHISILDRYNLPQEEPEEKEPNLLQLVQAKQFVAADKHLQYLYNYKRPIEPHPAYETAAFLSIREHNYPNYRTFFRWLSITPSRSDRGSNENARPYAAITRELCRSGALDRKKKYILRFASIVAGKGYYNAVIRRDILPVLARPGLMSNAAELKAIWSDIESNALEYEAANRPEYTIALGRTMRNDLVTALAELGWFTDAVDVALKKSPYMQMNNKHIRNLKLRLKEVGDEKNLKRLEAFSAKPSVLFAAFHDIAAC